MRVMVIGGDGTIGNALVSALAESGDEVIATSRRKSPDSARFFLDLADDIPQKLPDCDVAIICAALARFSDCRNNPALAHKINVMAPATIARRLSERGTKIILLSTGAVYDAFTPRIIADRPPNPRTVYGAQKAEAEGAILPLGPQMSVLRLTKLLYPEFPLIARWARALANSENIRAFANHAMSPITLQDAIETIIGIATSAAGGLFQISGAADISYLNAAKHVATRIGAPEELVISSRAEELIPVEEIMPFGSLDSSRVTKLTGFAPPEPRAVLDAVLSKMASFSVQRC
jgi:dTDP-4-dehydrorhamnose reductase